MKSITDIRELDGPDSYDGPTLEMDYNAEHLFQSKDVHLVPHFDFEHGKIRISMFKNEGETMDSVGEMTVNMFEPPVVLDCDKFIEFKDLFDSAQRNHKYIVPYRNVEEGNIGFVSVGEAGGVLVKIATPIYLKNIRNIRNMEKLPEISDMT